jgi:hypothetical protein
VASQQRKDDERRIRTTTRWLLYGSLAATAIFGGLAAKATHAHANVSDLSDSSSAETNPGNGDLFQGATAPEPSTAPPVAQSGGS